MTYAELLEELVMREALIVHCSRPGKGDEGIDGLLFPEDLKRAIEICACQSKELCCSVVWPDHTKTFGAVGIVLKPRSTQSVTLISTTDGGTSVNPDTGRRDGLGFPFSEQAVADTFAKATDYNEWNVQDADTIGVFVHPSEPWVVPKRIPLNQVPGYDPIMNAFGMEDLVGSVMTTLSEIATLFPALPIYSLSGAGIVRLEASGPIAVKAADIYQF
jgi:hypothetical protein